MIRALHVIASVAPRYGGTSRTVIEMCRALKETGEVDPEILCTDADGAKGRLDLPGANPHTVEGVKTWMFPRNFSESWKVSFSLKRWIQSAIVNYDLVHVHGAFSHSTYSAFSAAKHRGVPVVFSPHGMLAPYSLGGSMGKKGLYLRILGRRQFERSSLCLGTTPSEAEELRAFFPSLRVDWASLGVDTDTLFAPSRKGQFRQRFQIPKEAPLLLFLSRIHRKKGLADLLIPSLANLPKDTVLAVVGEEDPHDPGCLDEVKQAVTRYGLADRVRFCGPLYGLDKLAAYDDADCYVLPSHHENFGLTVVEALARGTPCVVSREVQSGSLVREANAGAIVELNPLALGKALQRHLTCSPGERAAISDEAKRFARSHLSWKSTAEKLLHCYRNTLSRLDSPKLPFSAKSG